METEVTKRVGAGWRNWKKCSGVLCDRRMPVKLEGEGLQNSDQTSDATRSRNVGYNEETGKTDRVEQDEDATMDVRSDMR